jgi:hypothetical protein
LCYYAAITTELKLSQAAAGEPPSTNTWSNFMESRNRWYDKVGFMGQLTCDLHECLNKRGGSASKTAYFGHLGSMVDVNDKRYHVKCLEHKKSADTIRSMETEKRD